VNPRPVERQLALAGVALVSALASLAVTRSDDAQEPSAAAAARNLPRAAEIWSEAAVGTYGPGLYGRPTECGLELTPSTRGVSHPVLPCGARIVVAQGGRQAETRVVDRRSFGQGQAFALTESLASELGITGVQLVRWRFAPRAE
jgi:hypothetical protein